MSVYAYSECVCLCCSVPASGNDEWVIHSRYTIIDIINDWKYSKNVKSTSQFCFLFVCSYVRAYYDFLWLTKRYWIFFCSFTLFSSLLFSFADRHTPPPSSLSPSTHQNLWLVFQSFCTVRRGGWGVVLSSSIFLSHIHHVFVWMKRHRNNEYMLCVK